MVKVQNAPVTSATVFYVGGVFVLANYALEGLSVFWDRGSVGCGVESGVR